MMKLRRRALPRTLLRFWLLYAMLVLVLLAVIGVPLYWGFYDVLSRETYNATADALKTMSRAMDTRMREMDRIAVQLSQNTRMLPYFLGQGGMYAYEAQQEIDKVRRSNDFIYDIAVYYTPEALGGKAGRIYAASGEYSPDLYFDYIYRYETWNAALFQQQIPSMVHAEMRSMENIWVHRSYLDQYVTYVCPLIGNMKSNGRGVVMFLINKNKMDTLIGSSVLTTEGVACISDSSGRMLYTADNTSAGMDEGDIALALETGLKSDTPVGDIAINNAQYAQITVQSEYNYWTYMCLLPKSLLMGKVYDNLMLILYTLLVALLLGLIIAWLLSVKSYTPIRQLSRKLAGLGDAAGRGDDLALISSTVDNLMQSNATLMGKLSSQSSLVRMQVLQNLLFNRFESVQDISKLISAADIGFPHKDFTVMAFSVKNIKEFTSTHDNSMQELIRFAMINAMEEMAQRNGCRGYGVDLPGENVTVLLLNLNADEHDGLLYEGISQEMSEFFDKNFHITFTVGVGNPCGAVGQAPESFRQAMAAVGERFVRSHERIIAYRQISGPGAVRWHPVEDERHMLDAIRQGNSLAAENAAGAIVSGILQRGLGAAEAGFILSAAANAVNKLLADMRVAVDWDVQSVILCRQETIWEWQEDMNEVLGEACQKVALIKESNNSQLKDQLMEYINAHYANSEISLQTLAGLFGLSMGYITRFFKDQTGVSLMHYLDQIRMGHATRLLGDTQTSLGDIVAQCGYIDETNFIRKFKGIYGQTPIQYRRSVQLQRRREAAPDSGQGNRP